MPHIRPFLLALVLLGASFTLSAQGKGAKAGRDSLRAVVADLRERIALADSAGAVGEGTGLRLELGALLPATEAVKLYSGAVAMADSLGMEADALRLRRVLADACAASGRHKEAHAVLRQVLDIEQERSARQAVEVAAQAGTQVRLIEAERDSVMAAASSTVELVGAQLATAGEQLRTWRIVAGALLFALLVLAGLLMWGQRRAARVRGELGDLRARIQALEERKAAHEVKAAPAPPLVTPSAPSTVAVDAEVLALFRMRGADRLATLKDALQREDHDKVVRVVHTLKPQLSALDAALFGPLCARITAGPGADAPAWNGEVHRLVAAVEDLLRKPQ